MIKKCLKETWGVFRKQYPAILGVMSLHCLFNAAYTKSLLLRGHLGWVALSLIGMVAFSSVSFFYKASVGFSGSELSVVDAIKNAWLLFKTRWRRCSFVMIYVVLDVYYKLLLFIIPGIYAMLQYMFAISTVFYEPLDMNVIEISKHIVKKRRIKFIGYGLAMLLVCISIFCIQGILMKSLLLHSPALGVGISAAWMSGFSFLSYIFIARLYLTFRQRDAAEINETIAHISYPSAKAIWILLGKFLLLLTTWIFVIYGLKKVF